MAKTSTTKKGRGRPRKYPMKDMATTVRIGPETNIVAHRLANLHAKSSREQIEAMYDSVIPNEEHTNWVAAQRLILGTAIGPEEKMMGLKALVAWMARRAFAGQGEGLQRAGHRQS